MDRYLKTRIESITESDFWGSMSKAGPAKSAVEAGLKGKRERAYLLLGEYHASTLAGEAAALVKSVEPLGHDSQASRELRERADRVLAHDIQGWHTTRIQFGKRIDFNADFGQSGQYGFHYLGWLQPVVRQYALTREKKYRDGFVEIIKQYYEQRATIVRRIPHHHPVFYELGARAKTQLILPAYALLAGDAHVHVDARESMLKLLMGFGRSLFRLQKTGYRAGNWQIVGSQSLFAIGACFPEWREASSWRKRGMEMVTEHAKRDFFADGGHGERCWGYGYMSLDGMIGFYTAAKRYGYLTGRKRTLWERFLRRGLQWFAATTSPNRYMLAYGDGGIGSAESIFQRAIELFPDFAKAPGAPGLLGVDRSHSAILRDSGYAFMRGGDHADAPFLSVNFGKTGGWHTHSDLLDFSLWCHGRPLIEEVGRWGSYDNALEPMFRSERSHNQVALDHVVMDRHKHEAHDVRWHADDRITAFSAWHEAYSKVRITRQIVMIDRAYFFIFDSVTSQEYIFQATNWLHAPSPFVSAGTGRWRTTGKPGCLVVAAGADGIRRAVTGVDYSAQDFQHPTRRGREYEFNKERHHLAVSKWCDVGAPQPITFGTLLVPFAGRNPPRALITPIKISGDANAQAAAFAVTVGTRRDLLMFNPACTTLECAGRKTRDPIAVRLGRTWHDLRMS